MSFKKYDYHDNHFKENTNSIIIYQKERNELSLATVISFTCFKWILFNISFACFPVATMLAVFGRAVSLLGCITLARMHSTG